MENGFGDQSLFSTELLSSLPWSERKSFYKGDIDHMTPSPGFVLRPLALHDYDLGFLNTLSELTQVGEVTREEYEERFKGMKKCGGTYFVVVIEDLNKKQIVGSATLVIEQKFIHKTATRGRIEDVVVCEACRGKQLGKLLVDVLILLAKKLGCYKLTLECKDMNIKFYESLGFNLDEQKFMIMRFKD